jgi:hypothetical protein
MSDTAAPPGQQSVDWNVKGPELEKLRGQQGEEIGRLRAEVETLKKSQRPALPDDMGLDALIPGAGLDSNAVMQSLAQSGKLSDEHLAAITTKTGLPKRLVAETFERDAKQRAALSVMAQEAGVRILGGKEQYQNFEAWYKALPADQKTETDRLLSSGTTFFQGFDLAIKKHRESVGAAGSTPLLSGTAPAASGAAFRSVREIDAEKARLKGQGIDWSRDSDFIRRLEQTDPRIKGGF